MLKAARNTGKTLAGADAVIKHLREFGATARVGIMAPTQGDVIGTCAEGPTGLITLFGNEFIKYNRSTLVGGEAWHYKGGYVRFVGSEKPARWNGPQWSMRWIDEAALCRYDSIRHGDFGLRLSPARGVAPREIWTMTPYSMSRQLRERLVRRGVTVTRASMYDNKFADPTTVQELEALYEGTTLGRAFLLGLDVDIPEGAIWGYMGEHRTELLVPMPKGAEMPVFEDSGAGVDWGTSQAHLAAIVYGAREKMLPRTWIRRIWSSPHGRSGDLIRSLSQARDHLGTRWAAIDRSQWSIADWVEDNRMDSLGEPVGAGMQAIVGDRNVDWRNALVLTALEKGRLLFDSEGEGVQGGYDFCVQYHRDEAGKVVEAEDDIPDALAYLMAEIEHPSGQLRAAGEPIADRDMMRKDVPVTNSREFPDRPASRSAVSSTARTGAVRGSIIRRRTP